ncbi:MAG: 1-acyl-sn-glycerol-3-phosphate acyltransferase [Treponema sp.]|jgi:1-acyl-sn-glycerol-3-phosphate acyltransferase|nr:1-acyl-sn-glycerol-3-phosphate acyltransferase [Treponema sp.]
MIRTVFLFFMTGLLMLFVTPFGIIAFILQWFALKKPMAWAAYRLAQFWAYGVKLLSGCPVEVLGKENIPKKGGVCFVSNHGSMYDIILALTYIGRPFGFIAKKELLLVPVLNLWISILGGLFINRKNPRKAIRTINEGVRRLKKGGAMLIFPEGHRSGDQGLLPFHPGSLKLATQAQVPIIPVSIKGSYDIFEKNGRFTKVSLRVAFGKPLSSTELKKQELADEAQRLVEEGLK